MRLLATVAAVLWAVALTIGSAQAPLAPSAQRAHPAIAYATTPTDDAIARLNQRIARGEVSLAFSPDNGYLEATLEAVGVPVESQVLVFSKTSFQAPKINPRNPRAIYFSDTVSIGWVRGGDVLEAVALDRRQGGIFYTLEQKPADRPQFKRDLACVTCHTSGDTLDVPGFFLGSVYPEADGRAMYAPAYITDHRTPFAVRWGGWYVTGSHRFERHLGNATATGLDDIATMVTPETLHVDRLDGRFEMRGYPSPWSDIVALMVLEHQARMGSLITRTGWDARLGAQASRPMTQNVAELVDYMLFVDEAPLPAPVTGPSRFTETFSARGPHDSQGRSLYQLALDSRLMKYPCSFMIYSEPFDALPDDVKQAIYTRLWEILSGKERSPRYDRLTAADRRAIVEILAETKADLPHEFYAYVAGP